MKGNSEHSGHASGTPFKGLHPHDFRRYVAAVLDTAGLTAREVADHEGISRTTWSAAWSAMMPVPRSANGRDIEPPKDES